LRGLRRQKKVTRGPVENGFRAWTPQAAEDTKRRSEIKGEDTKGGAESNPRVLGIGNRK